MRLLVLFLISTLCLNPLNSQVTFELDLGASFNIGDQHFTSTDGKVEDQAYFCRSIRISKEYNEYKKGASNFGLLICNFGIQSTRIVYPYIRGFGSGGAATESHTDWETDSWTGVGVTSGYSHYLTPKFTAFANVTAFYVLYEKNLNASREKGAVFPELKVIRSKNVNCFTDIVNIRGDFGLTYRLNPDLAFNISSFMVPFAECMGETRIIGFQCGISLGT